MKSQVGESDLRQDHSAPQTVVPSGMASLCCQMMVD